MMTGEFLSAILCALGVGWMCVFLLALFVARPTGEGRRVDNSRPSVLDGPDDRILREDLYPAERDVPPPVWLVTGRAPELWEMPPLIVAPGTNPRGVRRITCRTCLDQGFLGGCASCARAGAE
jgi:hypothetical protein